MQDMQAKLGKLLTEAENCALIAKLAPNAPRVGAPQDYSGSTPCKAG
jgi:hypothetical protein